MSETPTETEEIYPELLEEYLNDLHGQASEIEQAVSRLRQASGDAGLLSGLFRAFHNLKGAAAMCRFEPGVAVAHRIESVLDRMRTGEISMSPLLGEMIMLTLDRLELAAGSLMEGQSIDSLRLGHLARGLDDLATAPPERVDSVAGEVIEHVSGFRPGPSGEELASLALAANISEDPAADLVFFRSLALQLEQRSSLFQGRTARIRQLALAMNVAAGKPVDPMQLEAAVYMHDVGMMFLPEPLWLKPGRLDEEEWAQMRLHPGFAADLLGRMKGWSEAALMVLQHHEKADGTGYPDGRKGEGACAGAKILAVADAFEAVTLRHAHRGQKVSTLRAAAEINGCEGQFDAEWIGPFNRIVRTLL
jgi:HPt (histidine-containing phosphotransfer) domain-containing protein